MKAEKKFTKGVFLLQNNMKKLNLIIIPISIFISMICISCTQVLVGGAASGGIMLVQERTPEQAGKDILIKTKIEEAFFSTNYDDIFSWFCASTASPQTQSGLRRAATRFGQPFDPRAWCAIGTAGARCGHWSPHQVPEREGAPFALRCRSGSEPIRFQSVSEPRPRPARMRDA